MPGRCLCHMGLLSTKGRCLRRALIAALGLMIVCQCGPTITAQTPEPTTSPDAAQTRYLLRASAADLPGILSANGLTVVDAFPQHNLYLVQSATQTTGSPGSVLNSDSGLSDSGSGSLEPNSQTKIREAALSARLNEATIAILDSADPTPVVYHGVTVWNGYANQPASQLLRLQDSHRRFATGAGIIAVIDTGVDPNHALLASALVPGYDFIHETAGIPSEWIDVDPAVAAALQAPPSGTTQTAQLNEATIAILDEATIAILDGTLVPESFGHGTMVAGLIRLVAPNARIMPIKAFRPDGTGTVFDAVRAIYYAVDHGARVISMSFGVDAPSAELMRAINYATSRGVICVGSAGNAGQEVLAFPASFGNVIGVGSTSLTDRDSKFSNFGDAVVRVAAPGEELITTYPGNRYAAVWGTSFSTGLVSGGLSLLLQVAPSMTPTEAAEFIRQGAVRNDFIKLGEGRIDLFAALTARGAGSTTTSANSAPVASNDAVTTQEDTPLVLDVRANDIDPDGDTLSVKSVVQPTNGNAVIATTGENAGRVVYQPRANFSGVDSFAYVVSDGMLTAPAVVMVTVTAVNDPPAAAPDAGTTGEDAAVVIDVLANDTDRDDDRLTVTAVTPPGHGSATLVTTGVDAGRVRYVPAANFSGEDSFTYTVSDGAATQTAVVTITVTGVNDPPVAGNDTVTIGEDGAAVLDVVANDSDADGDAVTVSTVSAPANGTAALIATGADAGKISYTPNANFAGTDSFTYVVSDGKGGTATATVTVTVTNINDPPTATSDTATTLEEKAVVVDVRPNDSDADGDALTVTAVTTPANGTAALVPTAPGSVTYTPKANFVGTDSFSYTVSDGKGGVAAATVTVEVTNVNDAPTAVDDGAAVGEDSGTAIIDVAVNDNGNPDVGETIRVDAVTQPGHGVAAVIVEGADAGKVSYTPAVNFFGSDSFTYTINDGNGGTATARVTVSVASINDMPTAAADVATVVEDSGANAIDVLANDSSAPDADETLTVTAVTSAGNGTTTVIAAGTDAGKVSYTPNANFAGTDSFAYTLSDGNGGVAVATVSVTVTNVNDPPSAAADTVSAAEDQAIILDPRTNDADPDDDAVTVAAVTQPANGVATLVTTGADAGKVSYTPSANFFGTDSFTYTISDGHEGVATATVAVSVTSVNDAPVAVSDSATTAEESPLVVSVGQNDTDADGDTLTVTAVGTPANGTAILAADTGTVTYTPNVDFAGNDSFTYAISDGHGGSATSTVTVTVTNVNDAPTAVADAATVSEDQVLVFDVRSNDADGDGDTTSVQAVTQPPYGAVAVLASGPQAGLIAYTPHANFFGTDNFTYTINDGKGGTATAAVVVSVTSVNDAPVAVGDTATTSEDAGVAIGVRLNDSDADGDVLNVTGVGTPSNGTATLAADTGIVTYTPRADFAGADSFTYSVADGNGGTATGTVTISVSAVADQPMANPDAVVVAEDQAAIVDVRSNDGDADNDPLTVQTVTQPAHGVAAVVMSGPEAGRVSYTPHADFFGTDSFTYTVSDGTSSATATVNVTVTSVNDAPATANDVATTSEESGVVVDVRLNDSDADGDVLTVTGVGTAANGTAALVGDTGSITYTPRADFVGTDSFSYTVSDAKGGVATGTVTVSVSAVNDVPTAAADAVTVAEDQAVVFDVRSNDVDTDGDPLNVTVVTPPAHGVAVLVMAGSDAGKVSYTPNANFVGADSFAYTVVDGNGGTATATVAVSVTAVNDSPAAADDNATTAQDTATLIDPRLNDIDPDGDTVAVATLGSPANGVAELLPTGMVSYTPNPGFVGSDSFTYAISDGNGGTAVGTVTVAVLTAQ